MSDTPNEGQSWTTHRNRRGWPTWFQRAREAWWIVIGSHSLHRAWQEGYDYGHKAEYRRLITNKAYLAEIAHSPQTPVGMNLE